MKEFSSEVGHNYKNYTFAYAQYCILEQEDKISDIYKKGYLPYSGSPDIKNVFYLARSARINLKNFVLSSENRRVGKKFDTSFKRHSFNIKDFDISDPNFLKFCTSYFAKRHGPKVMPLSRLKFILNFNLITQIVVYKKDDKNVAYVFEASDNNMTHFWYSFYDLSLIQRSLGVWLMLESAKHAKERGEDFFYIGTVYGEKALYKTAFNNIEFWDGARWSNDTKKLKELARTDDKRIISITDKEKNKNRFL